MNLIEIKDRQNETHFINPNQVTRIYFNGVIGRAGATTIELSSGVSIHIEKSIKEISSMMTGDFIWDKK